MYGDDRYNVTDIRQYPRMSIYYTCIINMYGIYYIYVYIHRKFIVDRRLSDVRLRVNSFVFPTPIPTRRVIFNN